MTDETTPKDPHHAAHDAAAPKAAGDAVAKALGLSAVLERGVADYLVEHDIRPASGDLRVDMALVRDHAGPLLAHLMRLATQTLLPKDLTFSVPMPPPENQPEAKPVNLSFDLGAFLSKLLDPPSTNPRR